MDKLNLPPYSVFPMLSDGNIRLREILDEDLTHLIEISFYNGIQAKTLEEATAMNTKINKDYDNGSSIHWGIVDLESNKVVGTCGYYRAFADEEGELGCVLLADYRGKGYMSAALGLAINYGLNRMGLKRVFAITDQQNGKAIKLLERLNFMQVKVLEDNGVEFEFRKAAVFSKHEVLI